MVSCISHLPATGSATAFLALNLVMCTCIFCATDSTQQTDRVLNTTLSSQFSLLFTKNKKHVYKCRQCGTKTLCKTARKQFCSKIIIYDIGLIKRPTF